MSKERKLSPVVTTVTIEILIQLQQQLEILSPNLGTTELLNIPDEHIKEMINQVKLSARVKKRIFNTIKVLFTSIHNAKVDMNIVSFNRKTFSKVNRNVSRYLIGSLLENYLK